MVCAPTTLVSVILDGLDLDVVSINLVRLTVLTIWPKLNVTVILPTPKKLGLEPIVMLLSSVILIVALTDLVSVGTIKAQKPGMRSANAKMNGLVLLALNVAVLVIVIIKVLVCPVVCVIVILVMVVPAVISLFNAPITVPTLMVFAVPILPLL